MATDPRDLIQKVLTGVMAGHCERWWFVLLASSSFGKTFPSEAAAPERPSQGVHGQESHHHHFTDDGRKHGAGKHRRMGSMTNDGRR